MKRRGIYEEKICAVLSSAMLATMLSVPAQASEEINVLVDDQKVDFDVAPQLIGGRTMVPLRAIFEAIGAVVEWDDSTKTVTAYNEAYIVKATIGDNTMYVNNQPVTIDVPPMIVDERTLVPARFVAEAFDCEVEWDAESMSVFITTNEIDYSKLENDVDDTEYNENDDTNIEMSDYYPGTMIPTYSSVIGVAPIGEESLDDGFYLYRYPYDMDSFLGYCLYLESNGWTEYKNETDYETGSFVVYYVNDMQMVSVSAEIALNETWILYGVITDYVL